MTISRARAIAETRHRERDARVERVGIRAERRSPARSGVSVIADARSLGDVPGECGERGDPDPDIADGEIRIDVREEVVDRVVVRVEVGVAPVPRLLVVHGGVPLGPEGSVIAPLRAVVDVEHVGRRGVEIGGVHDRRGEPLRRHVRLDLEILRDARPPSSPSCRS